MPQYEAIIQFWMQKTGGPPFFVLVVKIFKKMWQRSVKFSVFSPYLQTHRIIRHKKLTSAAFITSF